MPWLISTSNELWIDEEAVGVFDGKGSEFCVESCELEVGVVEATDSVDFDPEEK